MKPNVIITIAMLFIVTFLKAQDTTTVKFSDCLNETVTLNDLKSTQNYSSYFENDVLIITGYDYGCQNTTPQYSVSQSNQTITVSIPTVTCIDLFQLCKRRFEIRIANCTSPWYQVLIIKDSITTTLSPTKPLVYNYSGMYCVANSKNVPFSFNSSNPYNITLWGSSNNFNYSVYKTETSLIPLKSSSQVLSNFIQKPILYTDSIKLPIMFYPLNSNNANQFTLSSDSITIKNDTAEAWIQPTSVYQSVTFGNLATSSQKILVTTNYVQMTVFNPIIISSIDDADFKSNTTNMTVYADTVILGKHQPNKSKIVFQNTMRIICPFVPPCVTSRTVNIKTTLDGNVNGTIYWIEKSNSKTAIPFTLFDSLATYSSDNSFSLYPKNALIGNIQYEKIINSKRTKLTSINDCQKCSKIPNDIRYTANDFNFTRCKNQSMTITTNKQAQDFVYTWKCYNGKLGPQLLCIGCPPAEFEHKTIIDTTSQDSLVIAATDNNTWFRYVELQVGLPSCNNPEYNKSIIMYPKYTTDTLPAQPATNGTDFTVNPGNTAVITAKGKSVKWYNSIPTPPNYVGGLVSIYDTLKVAYSDIQNVTATFYATQMNGTCESEPTIVTVKAIDTANIPAPIISKNYMDSAYFANEMHWYAPNARSIKNLYIIDSIIGGTVTWYSDSALTTILGTGNTLAYKVKSGSNNIYAIRTIGTSISDVSKIGFMGICIVTMNYVIINKTIPFYKDSIVLIGNSGKLFTLHFDKPDTTYIIPVSTYDEYCQGFQGEYRITVTNELPLFPKDTTITVNVGDSLDITLRDGYDWGAHWVKASGANKGIIDSSSFTTYAPRGTCPGCLLYDIYTYKAKKGGTDTLLFNEILPNKQISETKRIIVNVFDNVCCLPLPIVIPSEPKINVSYRKCSYIAELTVTDSIINKLSNGIVRWFADSNLTSLLATGNTLLHDLTKPIDTIYAIRNIGSDRSSIVKVPLIKVSLPKITLPAPQDTIVVPFYKKQVVLEYGYNENTIWEYNGLVLDTAASVIFVLPKSDTVCNVYAKVSFSACQSVSIAFPIKITDNLPALDTVCTSANTPSIPHTDSLVQYKETAILNLQAHSDKNSVICWQDIALNTITPIYIGTSFATGNKNPGKYYYQVYAHDSISGCNSQPVPVILEITSSTASNFEHEDTTILYPNPVNSKLYITSNETLENSEIINLDGIIIQQKEGNENYINVSNLALGMYILKVKTKKTVHFKTFIKQ